MPRMTTPDRTPTELAASRFPLTLTTSGRIGGNSSWCCPSLQTPPRRLRNPGQGPGQVGDCLIIDRLGAPDAGNPHHGRRRRAPASAMARRVPTSTLCGCRSKS